MKQKSFSGLLDTQDLQAVVVADGDPVWLCWSPLHVVDLPFGGIGQDGVFDGTWHLLDIPDQSLMIVGWKDRANVLSQEQEEKQTETKVFSTHIWKKNFIGKMANLSKCTLTKSHFGFSQLETFFKPVLWKLNQKRPYGETVSLVSTHLQCRCDRRNEGPRRCRWHRRDGCWAAPRVCTAHGHPGWPPTAKTPWGQAHFWQCSKLYLEESLNTVLNRTFKQKLKWRKEVENLQMTNSSAPKEIISDINSRFVFVNVKTIC